MAIYGDHHRLFLQMMMLRKICMCSEIWDLYILACSTYNIPVSGEKDKAELAAFMNSINLCLRPLNVQLKKGVCEITGIHHYALVNAADTSLSKLASDYSTLELELYKKLVEKIVLSDNGSITSIEALNLTNDWERRMSKKDAEEAVAKFCKDQWLVYHGRREITLSTRALIELEPYLCRIYSEDVSICHMCKQIVLLGKSCNQCATKLHFHCATRCFRDKEHKVCPQCRCVWV